MDNKEKAFIVVTDLHLKYTYPEFRESYFDEMIGYLDYIIKLATNLDKNNYDVNIIFLGDIFDNSVSSLDSGFYYYDLFTLMSSKFKLYSVVGNHETTYYENNLFWRLTNSIDSKLLLSISGKKAVNPTGLTNKLHVVDRLTVGSVQFVFNHHDTRVLTPEGKTNILLCHNDFMNKDLDKYAKEKYGQDSLSKYIRTKEFPDEFKNYDYVCLGHNHGLYLDLNVNFTSERETNLLYLASIGRPNISEVRDNFLERMLPIFIIDKEGNFKGVNKHKFQLLSEKEVIKEGYESVLAREKEKRKKAKVVKKAKTDKTIVLDGDPVDRIRVSLGDNEGALDRFYHLQNLDYRDVTFDRTRKIKDNLISQGYIFNL